MHQQHHIQTNTNSSYNDVDETLGKPNHYTIVKEDFNAQVWKRTNPMETVKANLGLLSETKEVTP